MRLGYYWLENKSIPLRKENKKLTEDLIKSNDQLEFLLRQNLLS
jgi:hypothetical protein